MLFEDSETVALIIKNVTEADAGKIQVVARNELGACTSEADLVIKGEGLVGGGWRSQNGEHVSNDIDSRSESCLIHAA